ncbi:YciI family protein [Actinosynnema sp. NPDC020468]|uniref:YciI family protein n=1 Tax=Actinosynnema sp. NPDC020468 TaxID=3154488 RepID=UPI0033C4C9A9
MSQYLLAVIEPSTGTPPSPDALAAIMRDVDAVDADMRRDGVWVFAGGLHGPDSATTLRPGAGEVLVVDGPFAEGKEHLGGFTIVDVPDLDAALEWGRRLSAATTLPVEVRPFR